MTKEYKNFQCFETKIDNLGIVESLVAIMGNVDYGRDVIHPGAFTKTITERKAKIKVLDMHNSDSVMRVVGKVLELRELSKFELPPELLKEYPEATGALWAKTQFLLDTPEGKGVFERIKAGTVDQWSIGYDVLDSDMSKVKTKDGEVVVRNLRTIKLYEYSPVIWGMNPATDTLDAKSEDGKMEEEIKTEETPIEENKEEEVKQEKGYTSSYIGPMLQGLLFGNATNLATYWLQCNHISYEELISITNAVVNGVNAFTSSLPKELAQREAGKHYEYGTVDYSEMGYTPNLESKAFKAGRVLSARNISALQNAIEKLQEVLKAAMPMEDEEMPMDEEDEDKKPKKPEKALEDKPEAQENGTGPIESPILKLDAWLEKEELELLETF